MAREGSGVYVLDIHWTQKDFEKAAEPHGGLTDVALSRVDLVVAMALQKDFACLEAPLSLPLEGLMKVPVQVFPVQHLQMADLEVVFGSPLPKMALEVKHHSWSLKFDSCLNEQISVARRLED